MANACTSPLVGRRDPLGAGLRIEVETEWGVFAGLRSDPCLPACASSDGTTVARGRDLIRVRPVASADGQSGCRTQCRHRTRSTAGDGVLGQTPYTPVGDALALGTFRTRLETRTKESSMCASHWDLNKPKGVMKVKVSPRACLGRMRRALCSGAALPGRLVLIAS